MACSGSHCTDYGTGTTTCNQHRASCATNRAFTPTGDYGVSQGKIWGSDIELLRSNIMAELDAFNLWQSANAQPSYSKYDPGTISGGQVINHTHINSLDNTLSNLHDSGVYKNTGDLITPADWNGILSAYNLVRQDCICNSDCACNNVCSCHNNCDCNYSDERLKENIVFLRKENGLNLYSFTYLWDKTKTYIGVMAQELLNTSYAPAVLVDNNGYYKVDYSKLPNLMRG